MSTRLLVRVAPGAARPGIAGRHRDGWKLRVAAAPEGGKANDAVVALLADTLGVPKRDVRVVSGKSTRDKTVALDGIDHDEIEQRLAAASAAGKDPQ